MGGERSYSTRKISLTLRTDPAPIRERPKETGAVTLVMWGTNDGAQEDGRFEHLSAAHDTGAEVGSASPR
jgi:hypothetical protein